MKAWTTKEVLEEALSRTNQSYASNVAWNRSPEKRGKAYIFTLRCVSSRSPGHRVSYNAVPFGGSPRRLTACCWHVHRDFLSILFSLDPSARVLTSLADYRTAKGFTKNFPLTAHHNVGSRAYPVSLHDTCECNT